MRLDAQVDMLEFKDYREVDLNESPVVALACGHFFTAETLDGTYDFRGFRMASAVAPITRAELFLLMIIILGSDLILRN